MAKYDKIDSELAYFQKRSRGNTFTKTNFRPNKNLNFSGVKQKFFIPRKTEKKNFPQIFRNFFFVVEKSKFLFALIFILVKNFLKTPSGSGLTGT